MSTVAPSKDPYTAITEDLTYSYEGVFTRRALPLPLRQRVRHSSRCPPSRPTFRCWSRDRPENS